MIRQPNVPFPRLANPPTFGDAILPGDFGTTSLLDARTDPTSLQVCVDPIFNRIKNKIRIYELTFGLRYFSLSNRDSSVFVCSAVNRTWPPFRRDFGHIVFHCGTLWI